MTEDARSPVLELRNVSTHYGLVSVLRDVDMAIYPGEMVFLLGGNASGKSTTMKTILGLVRPKSGTVRFAGADITHASTRRRVAGGIASVPEARRVFPDMTVDENLIAGAYTRRSRSRADKAAIAEDLDRMRTHFPRLAERRRQQAGTLSGGEQQMLAIGRALMSRPKLVCMDEPTMGLSPLFVDRVLETIETIHAQGIAVFMVEQNANLALQIAQRSYVLQNGHIGLEGAARELLDSPEIQDAYLGEARERDDARTT